MGGMNTNQPPTGPSGVWPPVRATRIIMTPNPTISMARMDQKILASGSVIGFQLDMEAASCRQDSEGSLAASILEVQAGSSIQRSKERRDSTFSPRQGLSRC